MYNRNFRNTSRSRFAKGNSFRPQAGGFPRPQSVGSPRVQSSGSPRAGSRGRRAFTNPGLRINVNRFINRAVPQAEVAPYTAINRFQDFAIHPAVKQNITRVGYIAPTAIQDQTIPLILEGKDVIGVANTGTGKTAAFLIPLIHKVATFRQEKFLVIVPTRELAHQIQDEFVRFSQTLGLSSVVIIGGMGMGNQIRALRRNPTAVIGTPGRLKDLIERKVLFPSNYRTVVLDEADRMLDMGFITDIRFMLALLPSPRQTLLFSATLSSEIDALTRQFQNNPIKISAVTGVTPSAIDQNIVRFGTEESKVELLHDLLKQSEFEKVLVFGQTKHGVERLSKDLNERGFKAASIHGNKTQSARQKALNLFKQNDISILVATDVAARGLDIPHVSHVINYDIPASYDDYVHRIGRTGRAGNTGKALTFVR